jgi:hypothetical protein
MKPRFGMIEWFLLWLLIVALLLIVAEKLSGWN